MSRTNHRAYGIHPIWHTLNQGCCRFSQTFDVAFGLQMYFAEPWDDVHRAGHPMAKSIDNVKLVGRGLAFPTDAGRFLSVQGLAGANQQGAVL